HQRRSFTADEWQRLTAEAKRICAKAQRGLYSGTEDFASATKLEQNDMGFRVGFNEPYAWRTFAHPEAPIPMQNAAIALVDGSGTPGTQPEFTTDHISLNGPDPDESYETFRIERAPQPRGWKDEASKGIFNCCKTEYRPYDAVVVSILAAAQIIAPNAFRASSDGGPSAIKLMF